MSLELQNCEITGVFGPPCSGKTNLIEQWLRSCNSLSNRYVRFDSTGETLDNLEVEHVWKSPRQLYERLRENPYFFRIAYHPGENLEEDFRFALKCLWRIDVFKLIVIDEFHEVCNVNQTPRYVQTMIRYARHNHLSIVAASQRVADVHRLFTAACRQVIIFNSEEARDFVAVKERWGIECAEAMRALRPLIYDDSRKVTLQIPQCLVLARGKKAQVYDFQSKQTIEVDTSDNGLPEGPEENSLPPAEIQREDTGSTPAIEPPGGDTSSGLD